MPMKPSKSKAKPEELAAAAAYLKSSKTKAKSKGKKPAEWVMQGREVLTYDGVPEGVAFTFTDDVAIVNNLEDEIVSVTSFDFPIWRGNA